MSLKQYRKKRDFTRTLEPEGFSGSSKNDTTLRFTIHKHSASRLHYDLRLELDGVLKSWAVPKGITLDPEEKRLAVMVEDHPLDYIEFEGVIPEENYGAGTVMVWDSGTYRSATGKSRAESEKEMKKGLEKGHVSFILEGRKLKGEFALVRLKKAKGNSWLLIKKHDEFARPSSDGNEDRSVLTGRTMGEIVSENAPGRSAINLSSLNLQDIPLSEMPEHVRPMLATLVEEPFDRPGWLFEIKWDGYRVLVEIRRRGVRLYSRNDITLNDKFPAIVHSLEALPVEALLDGELVVLDSTGMADFQLLQNYLQTRRGSLVYYVFDILYLEGHDLRSQPLRRRKFILSHILPKLPHIRLSEGIEEDGVSFFRAAAGNGVEGIMAKNESSPYRPGARGQDWLKIKNSLRQDAVIGGFTSPRRGRKYFGSLVLGVYENGELVYIGHSGGGFSDAELAGIHEKLQSLKSGQCPFKQEPKTNTPATWVRPELVCEVSFSEWTDEGYMRQPVFLGLRTDKSPTEVMREIPKRIGDVLKKGRLKLARSEKEHIIVEGTGLALTNLDKIFWPDEGYTKRDLVTYYREIAPVILPYLKDRPQSLHRFPDGINGESFFQKDVEDKLPAWIQTALLRSESEDRTITYMLCQDKASLLYMANLGCIEINPWNARFQTPDFPDYLVLDLDPLDIDFQYVVEAALVTRDVLELAGAEGFCKTSGGTGLHVFVPMGARYSTEQVIQFARIISIFVHYRLPQSTSLARPPGKRWKKVYLDYLQNRRGQTVVSAYCLRPRRGAPVSAPLKWQEVSRKLDSSAFHMRNIFRRLEKIGDLWDRVVGPGIDMEACLKQLEAMQEKFMKPSSTRQK
ncbi:MAG: DNA ligase D [Syntrophales bacterium]